MMTDPHAVTLTRHLPRIGYYSEPVADYHTYLDSCADLTTLRQFLTEWRLLAHDAELVAQAMTAKDWKPYQKGLRAERRGKYSGDEWSKKFADILLPGVLFHVSIVANRFMVPWGCAYIRCREHGKIVEQDGVAVWKERALTVEEMKEARKGAAQENRAGTAAAASASVSRLSSTTVRAASGREETHESMPN